METPPTPTDTLVPPVQPQFDTTGRVCLICGYDLTGLQASETCPECGTPLQGNLLRYSAPEYLKKLHTGVFLVLASIIAMVLMMIGAFVLMATIGATGGVAPAGFELTLGLVGIAASLAFLVGWWLLSEPDPAFLGSDNNVRARQLVRVMVVTSAVLAVINFTLEHVLGYSWAAAGAGAAGVPAITSTAVAALAVNVLVFVAWAVQYFASMSYVKWLARRIPDSSVERRAKRLMWLGPILYFPGCLLLGLGPLIALILYWNLLEDVRKQIKEIRAEEGLLPG